MASSLANGESSPGYPTPPLSLQDQLESFRRSDEARDSLMQRLLHENSRLKREVQDARNDLENEKMSRRQWQNQSEAIRNEVNQYRSMADSDPFTLALIDGDGCIFQESLLRAAGDGGSDAAHLLNNEIKQYLQERCGSTAARGSIMVLIYANLDDLSRKLAHVGLINTAGDFAAFARSFSLNQPLFHFVDVGRGKERADHKIKEMFRLFVNNTHCKQIIFGGCHDNGYLLSLEPYRRESSVLARMTLLETTDAEWQYRNLGFPIIQFNSVFRRDPLPDYRSAYPQTSAGIPYPPGIGPPGSQLASPPVQARTGPPQVGSPVTSSSPFAPTKSAPPNGHAGHSNGATRPPASGLKSPSPAPSNASYAAVGGHAETRTISIAPSKEPRQRKYALFNSENERIDEKLPKCGQDAEMRFHVRTQKTGNCCNNFHLKGNCKAGSTCRYSHDPLLPPEQRAVLRHRARTSPCPRGSGCTDVACYLGHICPSENCTRRDCYFAGVHDVDTTPALKVYDDDEVEIIAT